MVHQRRVPNAEVAGDHECLLRCAIIHAPSSNRKGPGDGHLGHEKGARKAIRRKFLGVESGLVPLLNKLVDLHSVAPVVVTKLMAQVNARRPGGRNEETMIVGPDADEYIPSMLGKIQEPDLYAKFLGEVVHTDSMVKPIAHGEAGMQGRRHRLPGYRSPVVHSVAPREARSALD